MKLQRSFETGDFFRKLFDYIGDDSTREGLKETPVRIINAWEEIFSGYNQDPNRLIKTFQSDGYNQLVLLKDIELYSMCEHHMFPFIGKAHVGYIPKDKVIGISKVARIVDIFSRRLQIQERLTDQISECLWDNLKPIGVACVIEAQHLCMRMRGIGKQNSIMKTSSLKGIFIEKTDFGSSARSEFFNLIKGN